MIAWYTSGFLFRSAAVHTGSPTVVVTGREGRGSASQRRDGNRKGDGSTGERSWARSLPGGRGIYWRWNWRWWCGRGLTPRAHERVNLVSDTVHNTMTFFYEILTVFFVIVELPRDGYHHYAHEYKIQFYIKPYIKTVPTLVGRVVRGC